MPQFNSNSSPAPSGRSGGVSPLLETQRRIRPIHPAYETNQLCPSCNRILLRIGNGCIVSCADGHLFTYPDLVPHGRA